MIFLSAGLAVATVCDKHPTHQSINRYSANGYRGKRWSIIPVLTFPWDKLNAQLKNIKTCLHLKLNWFWNAQNVLSERVIEIREWLDRIASLLQTPLPPLSLAIWHRSVLSPVLCQEINCESLEWLDYWNDSN